MEASCQKLPHVNESIENMCGCRRLPTICEGVFGRSISTQHVECFPPSGGKQWRVSWLSKSSVPHSFLSVAQIGMHATATSNPQTALASIIFPNRLPSPNHMLNSCGIEFHLRPWPCAAKHAQNIACFLGSASIFFRVLVHGISREISNLTTKKKSDQQWKPRESFRDLENLIGIKFVPRANLEKFVHRSKKIGHKAPSKSL